MPRVRQVYRSPPILPARTDIRNARPPPPPIHLTIGRPAHRHRPPFNLHLRCKFYYGAVQSSAAQRRRRARGGLMLSEQSAATVRATLPVVGAAIGEITERFYAGLFEARPEL